MPIAMQADYEEAAAISSISPRASAALLRMCVENLCKHLSAKSKFDDAMDALAKQGLPAEIQIAMDVVRLNGNEVLHAGQLYGNDDNATVSMLFRLVNLIVTWAITEKRELAALYEQIPPEKRAKLEERRKQSKSR